MDVPTGNDTFYHRFVRKLSCSLSVIGPVVAADEDPCISCAVHVRNV